MQILVGRDLIEYETITLHISQKINVLILTERVAEELQIKIEKFPGEITDRLPIIIKPKPYSLDKNNKEVLGGFLLNGKEYYRSFRIRPVGTKVN